MNLENEEDKLLIDKVLDKANFARSKNKVSNTLFLNEREQRIVTQNVNLDNSFFYGIVPNAERKILIFYPEKISEEICLKNISDLVSVIRIKLPEENKGKYEHKNYLSALMKIGLERERIGDILVDETGADIIILKQNVRYALDSLKELTRFKKASIEEINIDEIRVKEEKFEEFQIIVPSLRIDSIVSELARCSRGMADTIIEEERVLVNYETIYKSSKAVQIGDIITIRGKGKFILDELLGNTRKENLIVRVKKYA